MIGDVAMTGEPFSGVDRAWLNMERPTNPMMVVGLIVFGAPLELDRLRGAVRERFLAIERFRCIPVAGMTGARWEPLRQIEVDDHVISVALPEPGGQAELEALVGELAGAPFNPARPLWSFHLVERYGKGSALIARIHHAYADGIALVQVLLGLADRAPATKAHRRQHRPGQPPPDMIARESHAPVAPQLLSVLPAPVLEALGGAAGLIEQGIHYLLHPQDAAAAARGVAEFAGELAHIAALSDDPSTCLKRPLSGVHRVAWADPLLLEEVKTIGRLLGCTVNDVLVSTLAGALGRLLATQAEVPEDLVIRAVVPVNLRAATAPALGNRFGLVFVELPVGTRHPLQRLYRVRAAMQALKGSPQPLVTLGVLWAVGSLPRPVEDYAIDLFSAKASLVASNLPGPSEPLEIGGARVSEVLFWVPQSGSLGVGVSMLSYAGRVQFGVMADRNLLPHPAELVTLVAAEFERLVYLVLLGGAALGA
jgi:diacylglycerol O-acyltransferase / wax synthase